MFVCAQYTVDKIADPVVDPKEAETEHKLQEEVLKRYNENNIKILLSFFKISSFLKGFEYTNATY